MSTNVQFYDQVNKLTSNLLNGRIQTLAQTAKCLPERLVAIKQDSTESNRHPFHDSRKKLITIEGSSNRATKYSVLVNQTGVITVNKATDTCNIQP
jgi:hypothetical protein